MEDGFMRRYTVVFVGAATATGALAGPVEAVGAGLFALSILGCAYFAVYGLPEL